MHKDLTDRLRTRFQTLDGDGDQYLTGDDFDGEVNRILQATNVPATAPRARLLRSAYQAYWWAMLHDLDRDLARPLGGRVAAAADHLRARGHVVVRRRRTGRGAARREPPGQRLGRQAARYAAVRPAAGRCGAGRAATAQPSAPGDRRPRSLPADGRPS